VNVINQDKFTAIEQHKGLGQGFHLAQKDMNIRGFGNAFGEEQTGNIANVGTDLYFEMLFESLSKVKENTYAPSQVKQKTEKRNMHLHKRKSNNCFVIV
jgi:transcription-repair coupling factor (superfamily II helicase)